tara:strand:+ start:190 stop:366 length:177 start_codon:yes stop_codon:yes gene_type:complete
MVGNMINLRVIKKNTKHKEENLNALRNKMLSKRKASGLVEIENRIELKEGLNVNENRN